MDLSLRWNILRKIYNGVLGKALVVVSFFSLISAVPFFNEIASLNISLLLIGSFLIMLSYGMFIINIPNVINEYDLLEFSNINTDKHELLNLQDEFSILDRVENINDLYIFQDPSYNLQSYKNFQEYCQINGKNETIFSLSLIKYAYLNTYRPSIRIAITICLLLGLVAMYLPSAIRLVHLISQGLN